MGVRQSFVRIIAEQLAELEQIAVEKRLCTTLSSRNDML